ncbi:MAG TPA: molybdopterin synthase sulfur carrier subunit [Microbacterium sp.]|uniref:MoaD/ThiS family protein n=1 Tax=Microbacterium sp. TaxID=51671 RepID=UPI000ED2C70A|nr:molybdopterin synthase sulfur carrier subunit [Microbacterium sp.]
MAIVTVRYFAAASEAAGREQEQITLDTDPTLGALRDELLARYGDAMARVMRSGSFLVDGTVRRDLATPVGGAVDILPPFAGG